MKNRTSPSRIPASMRRATSVILGSVCAFDRIELYVDSELPPGLESEIAKHCGTIRVLPVRHPFQRIWETKIELHQPTPVGLKMLHAALSPRSITRVSYAEVAIDWLTRNRKHAIAVGTYFLEHLQVPGTRRPVHFIDATVYFNARHKEDGTRTPKVLVLYTDRPSKLLGRNNSKHCCHLEIRVQNHGACAKIGLNTIADCVSFDHKEFWSDALRLRDFSSMSELGTIVSSNSKVSGSALRARATRYLRTHNASGRYSGAFVLQDALRADNFIKKALVDLDNRHFLTKITLK